MLLWNLINIMQKRVLGRSSKANHRDAAREISTSRGGAGTEGGGRKLEGRGSKGRNKIVFVLRLKANILCLISNI